jgi:xanthine/uracil permease
MIIVYYFRKCILWTTGVLVGFIFMSVYFVTLRMTKSTPFRNAQCFPVNSPQFFIFVSSTNVKLDTNVINIYIYIYKFSVFVILEIACSLNKTNESYEKAAKVCR